MNKPSSRYLTHDFVVYQGLTLKELLVTAAVGMLGVSLAAALMGLFFGCPGLSAAFGLVLGFLIGIRVFPHWVAKAKAGKPQGYVRKRLVIAAAGKGLCQSPYVNHQGIWRKQRLVGEKHV
ncbi:TIGR03750 family conjugal transfer protein [Legionella fairfieldensis]|uniref:TIGR03750 family conjugal transfer protein n=1 Tax=Legionella fairfieldensis TaxID=45064 RepID=UPI00048A735F|nr:TIGR03750 family conjugal transfer protein [Legionella fairfieldensis]